jgi:hypothetical protein
MSYRRRRVKEQRKKVEFPPVIFYDEELDCMVRIDGWQMEVRRPGKRKRIEEFGLQLSFGASESLEPDWKPVKRYDCKHHYVEKHEYWRSRRAKRIREWEEKPLGEVLRLARKDLEDDYRQYISQMRKGKSR